MRRIIPAIGMLAICGLAQAEQVHWSELLDREEPHSVDPAAGAVTLDISGYSSWDFQGDADNEILSILFGPAHSEIFPLQFIWDLRLTTVGASWAEEATLTFNDTVTFNPGFGDAFTVSNMRYEGSMNGISLGETDADGFLNIEFHEIGFDDNQDAIDAFFGPGSTIRLIFPAPGTLGAMGLAGLVVCRRRRGGSGGLVG